MKKLIYILIIPLLVAAFSSCIHDEWQSDTLETVTVAQFLAAENEAYTKIYELEGTIGGTIDATFGNFNLTDETGTVYVHGLTATKQGYGARNDKSFASLGLKWGDKIVICGYRSSIDDKIEMVYAWFVKKTADYSGPDKPSEPENPDNPSNPDTPSDPDKPSDPEKPAGSVDNPYTVAQALDAVKDLTWTSNTEYESTEVVYMKGIISRIASNGTYTEGGTYGNASFYISDDGTENDEFFCFRILYLGNQKFQSGQTDIKVGDGVIICGLLMNYRGNTPETVSGKAYLYKLTPGSGGNPGGDTPSSGEGISFSTNNEALTWASDTDATYGSGYASTTEGLKIGFYKHTSSSNPVTPNASHIRIYKNSVLRISSVSGKKIKKIVIGCAPDAGTTTYCYDMEGLEGGGKAVADKTAKTVTWTGSSAKVVLQANQGQVRVEKLTVQFE